MFSFFRKMCPSSKPKFEVQNNLKLQSVLDKLNGIVRAEVHQEIRTEEEDKKVSVTYVDTGTTTCDFDKHKISAENFLGSTKRDISFMESFKEDSWKKHFKIVLTNNFSSWSPEELDNLFYFFAAFKQAPIEFTIDSEQLNALNIDQHIKMLVAMRPANIINYRIAYRDDDNKANKDPRATLETFKAIRLALPKTEINQARYFILANETAKTRDLLFAETVSTVGVKIKEPEPAIQEEDKKETSLRLGM